MCVCVKIIEVYSFIRQFLAAAHYFIGALLSRERKRKNCICIRKVGRSLDNNDITIDRLPLEYWRTMSFPFGSPLFWPHFNKIHSMRARWRVGKASSTHSGWAASSVRCLLSADIFIKHYFLIMYIYCVPYVRHIIDLIINRFIMVAAPLSPFFIQPLCTL